MKTLIISYSLTGNNNILAKGIGSKLQADHLEIKEPKKRSVLNIVTDVIFDRTPKVIDSQTNISDYDNLVFVAPVWLGTVASPMRKLLHELKGKIKNYSFVSISAGIDGANPKLEEDLIGRTGKKPDALINPLISDILPKDPKPGRKEMNAYRLGGNEATMLIDHVTRELQQNNLN